MKVILLFLCTLFINGFLLAQPVLMASNITPSGTEAFAINSCGVSSITIGAAGSGVTWNFAGLNAINIDTIIYSSCTGTALCDSVPGSAELSLNGSSYQFYSSDTNAFAVSGVTVSNGYLRYSIPRKIIFYPATFGASAKNNFAFSQAAALIFGRGSDSFSVDAYGTLTLPSGIFNNVLRVHTIQVTIDSNISGPNTTTDTFRTDVYSWYMPGFHSPLLSIYYDFSSLNGMPLLAQVLYYTPLTIPLGTASMAKAETELTVYPNPASGRLNLRQFAATCHLITIDIYDLLGHQAISTKHQELKPGNNDISINLPPLSPGIYFVHILSQAELVVKKVLIRQ